MNTKEQELAQLASAGDREAFGKLYDLYVKDLYRFIYYKTFHAQTTEDLTSQVFIKALNAISRFDESKGSISSWLYAIARNTVIDHYRTTTNDSSIEDVFDLSDGKDLDAQTDTLLKMEGVKEALSKLSAQQREIIVLRVWEQKSYQEIAELLSKSEAACKMQYARSLEKLQSLLPLSIYLIFLLNL